MKATLAHHNKTTKQAPIDQNDFQVTQLLAKTILIFLKGRQQNPEKKKSKCPAYNHMLPDI